MAASRRRLCKVERARTSSGSDTADCRSVMSRQNSCLARAFESRPFASRICLRSSWTYQPSRSFQNQGLGDRGRHDFFGSVSRSVSALPPNCHKSKSAEPGSNRRHQDFQSCVHKSQGDKSLRVTSAGHAACPTIAPRRSPSKKSFDDAGLAAVVEAWPKLLEAIKSAIVMLCSSVGSR